MVTKEELEELKAELSLLRLVYNNSRGYLRHNNVDEIKSLYYLNLLRDSIEGIKLIDSGTYSATEVIKNYENN